MGPTAAVLLANPLSSSDVEELHVWLQTLGTSYYDGDLLWEISFSDFGRSDFDERALRESCAFWVSLDSQSSVMCSNSSPTEQLQAEYNEKPRTVDQILGFQVKQRINVSAGCKKPIDHQLLGRLAAALADRYGALIDMNGEITPRKILSNTDSSLESHRSALRTYLRQFPGSVIEVPVRTGRGRIAIQHVVDATFLRAWMSHQDFSMGS